MGQHVWLLLATIGTELLVIVKWSKGQFKEPLPEPVRWAWSLVGALLVIYPAITVRDNCNCLSTVYI
jgi:phosphatidylserine synthase 2